MLDFRYLEPPQYISFSVYACGSVLYGDCQIIPYFCVDCGAPLVDFLTNQTHQTPNDGETNDG